MKLKQLKKEKHLKRWLSAMLSVCMMVVMAAATSVTAHAAGETTIVYYGFTQINSPSEYVDGQQYLFIPDTVASPTEYDCLTSVPAGSAILKFNTALSGTTSGGAKR